METHRKNFVTFLVEHMRIMNDNELQKGGVCVFVIKESKKENSFNIVGCRKEPTSNFTIIFVRCQRLQLFYIKIMKPQYIVMQINC